jgi:hypothetical protein
MLFDNTYETFQNEANRYWFRFDHWLRHRNICTFVSISLTLLLTIITFGTFLQWAEEFGMEYTMFDVFVYHGMCFAIHRSLQQSNKSSASEPKHVKSQWEKSVSKSNVLSQMDYQTRIQL